MPKFTSPALAPKGEQRTSFVSAGVGVGTPANLTYSRNQTAAADMAAPMTPIMKASSDLTKAIINFFKGNLMKIGSRSLTILLSICAPLSFVATISWAKYQDTLSVSWIPRELSYSAAIAVPAALILLIGQFRCPRCRLKIWETREPNFMRRVCFDRVCPRCGRDRDSVWPLQYLMAPEPWDGKKALKPRRAPSP